MAELPDLEPPWSRIPLVNDETNLFPEPTVGAMATEITKRVVDSPELSAKQAENITQPGPVRDALNVSFAGYTRPRPLLLPEEFSWGGAPIEIAWDGRSAVDNFNVLDHRPTPGKTVYLDTVFGSNSNDGLTDATPKKTFAPGEATGAYEAMSNGDELELLNTPSRPVWRTEVAVDSGKPVAKSISMVARHEGVKMPIADKLAWTLTPGTTNVYQATRANVLAVIDVAVSREGYAYQLVSSDAECDAMPGSWRQDGSLVKTNPLDTGSPDPNTVFALLNNLSGFTFQSITGAVEGFMSGIDIYGGARNLTLDRRTAGVIDLYRYRCGLFHATGPTAGRNDNFEVAGARKVYSQECVVMYSNKDGSNYSAVDMSGTTRNAPQVIEKDCVMGHFGLGQSADLSCNASTGHTGSKILRLGGRYFDSMGGVIADVHTGTQSVNIGVDASGSRTGLSDGRGAALMFGQGAEGWAFAGRMLDAVTGIYAESGSTVHLDSPWYFSAGGPGQIVLAA